MRQNILKFNYPVTKTFVVAIAATAVFVLAGATHQVKAATAPAITLKAGDQTFPVAQTDVDQWQTTQQQASTFISFEPQKNANAYILGVLGLQNNATSETAYANYDTSKIYQYLKSIEPEIDHDAEDAAFKQDPTTGVVTDFSPGTNGQDMDIKSSIAAIEQALDQKSTEADLAVNETFPKNKLSDTNNLGINELVAEGDSNYSGSTSNRIWNIKAGVNKESGVIVKPGEEFSFNTFLGPVDGAHGFKPELVIKGAEGTVPEFGGGLCQVSTTVFRAAMNAGFPITARRNHSYAVSYYSPQGTDATIYPGVQDLKFVNDTAADILVWATFPSKNLLRFSFYGTKDSRQVAFEGPTVYDRKPDGSMKATWTRITTEADGTKKTDVFNSNYQSPALFHKTEEFGPTTAEANPATSTSNGLLVLPKT